MYEVFRNRVQFPPCFRSLTTHRDLIFQIYYCNISIKYVANYARRSAAEPQRNGQPLPFNPSPVRTPLPVNYTYYDY